MSTPLKHFRTNITLRVILLGLTVTLAFAVYFWSGSLLASGLIGATAFYELFVLISYVEKTNRDLARLLDSIRYGDFSQGFTAGERGGSYLELSGALRGVVDDFRRARREKEESHRYLQTVMQHIGVGLISFSSDGDVSLINSAAKRLLGIPYLKSIDKLAEVSPRLAQSLKGLRTGQNGLVKIVRDGEALDLSIYATEFKLGGSYFKLVSLQDIRKELEDTEVEAWQKLTRVLAHEIMNSVAPIASLASTANSILEHVNPSSEDESEDLADIRGAVSTIARRSEGLLGFVESYRQVTRVPEPEKTRFQVRELLDDVERLMRPRLADAGIGLTLQANPPEIQMDADREQVEQVLINLVKNAVEALSAPENSLADNVSTADRKGPMIWVRARIDDRGRSVIEVSDNGPGIPDDVKDRMFVPFFTTKRDGSGIGLSLSREIIRRNGGSLYLDDGDATTFVIRL